MNAMDCLNILRNIKDCAFATVDENGMPQNRIIDVMIVEDEKLYFLTARGKHFYSELLKCGHAAITGLNSEWQTVRLVGKVEKLDDQKHWIDRIFELNPSMNEVYPGDARYILEAFCIKDGELEFFDLGKSPIYRESFSIGSGVIHPKGFVITDECIGCGLCAENCPQKCIDEGQPYVIRQENCLHCGLCFENCPVQAIVRREETV